MSYEQEIGRNLPVLFLYIGWADAYDGRHEVVGGLKYFEDGERCTEARAFKATRGLYRSGIGRGSAPELVHIVFVARNPGSDLISVVGVYASARTEAGENWSEASTKTAQAFYGSERFAVQDWPSGQGMRRWASRCGGRGREYPELQRFFSELSIPAAVSHPEFDDKFLELEFAFAHDLNRLTIEGIRKQSLLTHYSRDLRARNDKIEDALTRNAGDLACEVPGCGFNFFKAYGEVGYRFAEVHHVTPLHEAPAYGITARLEDLRVVCSNCHRMIHRGGECRSLESLHLKRA